jgi:uncharacterized membrane protein
MTAQQTSFDAAASEADIAENKDLAVISYAWLLSVIVLLAKGRSPYVRHHAKQGLVLFILSIALWVVPVIGRLLELLVLAGIIVGCINASQGKWKDVPIVGPISRGEYIGIRQDAIRVVQSFRTVATMLKKRAQGPGARAPEKASSQPESSQPS